MKTEADSSAPERHGKVRSGAVEEGVPEDAWKRLHPITPVLNGWQAIAIFLAFVIFQNAEALLRVRDLLAGGAAGKVLLIALGAVVGSVVLVMLYAYFSWRAMTYAVTDQAVWLRQGIFFRRQRHIRLERIQAVDVIHPLLGRIFGLGKISVDAAGGSGSSMSIGYLKDAELDDLRAQILALAAGLNLQTDEDAVGGEGAPVKGEAAVGGEGAVEGGDPPVRGGEYAPPPPPARDTAHKQAVSPRVHSRAPEAPEDLVYEVPVPRLAMSLLRSPWFIGTILLFVVLLVSGILIAVATEDTSVLFFLPGWLPFILVGASVMWTQFSREFNFEAAVSPDGIRIRRGLLEHRSETIPPRRVHAVSISQPLLWRGKGWYRVEISQAVNRTDSEGSTKVSQALLPVGTREEAMKALWLVLPDLGVEDVPAFFDAALRGTKFSPYFIGIAPRARVFDPWVARRRGIALTDTCVVVRDGFLKREASFAAYERLQSVNASTGPLESLAGAATVSAGLVPGPVRIYMEHLSFEDARNVTQTIVVRCSEKRAIEPPERWFARVLGETEPEAVPPVKSVPSPDTAFAPEPASRVEPEPEPAAEQEPEPAAEQEFELAAEPEPEPASTPEQEPEE